MAKNMSPNSLNNLIPTNKREPSELKKMGLKGAATVNANKKRAKSIQEAFLLLADLELNLENDKEVNEILEKNGIVSTERQVATFMQMQRAKADSKGFEVMRDSSGEKPKDTVLNLNVLDAKREAELLKEHFGIE